MKIAQTLLTFDKDTNQIGMTTELLTYLNGTQGNYATTCIKHMIVTMLEYAAQHMKKQNIKVMLFPQIVKHYIKTVKADEKTKKHFMWLGAIEI